MFSRFAICGMIIVLGMCPTAWAYESAGTRFGVMTASEYEYGALWGAKRPLLLDGEEILPDVKWRDSLTFIAVIPTLSSDLVLIQDNNGSECPALYYIINVSASAIKATPRFGSCSDEVVLHWTGMEVEIQMTSSGGMGKDAYIYNAEKHSLSLNGKPVTESR